MIRAAALLFCFAGFLAIMFTVANLTESGDVEARETLVSDDGCTTRELALDEGYGVSRKISQRICTNQE